MWTETVGHEKIIEHLKKVSLEGHLAHAYLFSGTEGIGKKRVALGFAQMLLCERVPEAPCEQCSHCKKIIKNCHPDCTLILPEAKTIKIDPIRKLKQAAYHHPLEANAKVIIIDEAEKMTDGAANALLKILEEPPLQTYFVLISSEPSFILPTIRSRCQKIVFKPLSLETLSKKLLQEGFSEAEIKQRASLAQGSLKRGVQFNFEQHQKYFETIQKFQKSSSPTQILELSSKLMEEEELEPFLESLNFYFYQQLLGATSKEEGDKKVKAFGFVEEAKRHLERYPNKQLLLENLLFRVAQL